RESPKGWGWRSRKSSSRWRRESNQMNGRVAAKATRSVVCDAWLDGFGEHFSLGSSGEFSLEVLFVAGGERVWTERGQRADRKKHLEFPAFFGLNFAARLTFKEILHLA